MKIFNSFILIVALLILEVIAAHQREFDFNKRYRNSINKRYRRHDRYIKREKRSIRHQQHLEHHRKNISGIKRSSSNNKFK